MAVQAQGWVESGSVCEFFHPGEMQMQRNQSSGFLNQTNAPPAVGAPPPTTFSGSIASQFEKQKQEIDRFISLQNERLISTLQQQRKQQLLLLMRRLESRASALLQQKEEDLLKASRRALELEQCLRSAQIERETWQRIARENEAMALALNNTLEQAMKQRAASSPPPPAEDAESCCDSWGRELGQSGKEDLGDRMACKACKSRSSCIVLLPCRHLCCCKSCEPFLGFCPVCKSAKEASVEVFMN